MKSIVGEAFYISIKKDKVDLKYYDLMFFNSKSRKNINKLICLPLTDGLLFSYFFTDYEFTKFDFLNLVNEYFTIEHIDLLKKYNVYYNSFNNYFNSF